ncbi:carboxypeptidase-like regulatory domain-containing protein [Hymenobacter sp. 15J16-1T3B]|uniref:carboxypeptidase-like regulatory domain-containing protein n=1 Tax=Hymenobacter sp. 15J16-1T3B TaxID=2886941 RepID=UPI001D0F5045|nr:carboxypeptidase-like regulatory domain-containing protein [Hymenobacter sp. 15J16-1T3B]MCC3158730.1 carboxypeptidase-like regulatory domain-containing protein [Hymenobacter sp. 15J16-1T3B]
MKNRFASALLTLFCALGATAQPQPTTLRGQIIDERTHEPLSYASIGVLHRPAGTVADAQGRFSLAATATLDHDSVRIALLGYAPLTLSGAEFRRQLSQPDGQLQLRPERVQLAEVVVRPARAKERVLGNSSNSTSVTGMFGVNRLGNQIGQGMHLRRLSAVEQISFHVAKCTYDSLFYRVNVYQVERGQPTRSLLPEPVYVRVCKGQIKDRLVVDLRPYHVRAEGDIVVALEMVKELGPGTLQLSASLLDGPIYTTENHLNGWARTRGVGIGIDATVVEYR